MAAPLDEWLERITEHSAAMIEITAAKCDLKVTVDKEMLLLDVIRHLAIMRSILDAAQAGFKP